jgi:ATP-dependent helicase YprA (DUF1998 family)
VSDFAKEQDKQFGDPSKSLITRDELIKGLEKRVLLLQEENERLRSTLKEVSGCQNDDGTPKLCEGCMIAIRCALEGKSLGTLMKEARDAEQTGNRT